MPTNDGAAMLGPDEKRNALAELSRKLSLIEPPPMLVIRRGWWKTTITERSVSD